MGSSRSMTRMNLLLLVVLAFHPPQAARAFSDKCAACQAVSAELELAMSNERPRNHLDMRHRLNSQGHREGKVIDYKVSELRVVELLDGLCSRMKDYTLETEGPEKGKWKKSVSIDSIQDRQQADAHSKHMSTYCGRLLEKTEEQLEERIRNGSMKVGEVQRMLCQELAQECKASRSSAEVDTLSVDDDEL
ncbi:hypothetical protein GOP47_0021496 [Adiantum capillus-veneris]|uniref:DUF3456 domain-containing protein n=1 Tax=Adiantum capillus-veneris TaxID=13818 RepID=A0A9D4Z6B1_ADICA|nr:hypothetical protein GOP47_0021496 [Adiantum capillus-veneris]